MNSELKNLLEENGIEPSKKEEVRLPYFEADPLKDLFDYFGQIFGDFEKKNGLPPFNNKKDDTDI